MSMISVIIPVYNAENYLKRSVDSVLNQSLDNIELILVDDGSTDQSGKICENYANRDERVIVFHKENAGVSSARNLGIKRAKGDYIMFLDSDDYMKPEMCKIMYNYITTKQSDVVICGTEETGGGLWRPEKNVDYDYSSLARAYPELEHPALLAPPWNKIYKREKINTLFDEKCSFGEDFMFNLTYLKGCQKISFVVDSPMFHTKDNPSSLSSAIYPSRLTEIENCFRVLVDFCACFYTPDQICSKYLNDIAIYSRKLLRSNSFKSKELIAFLTSWHKDSALRFIPICREKNLIYKNRILLLELKYGFWWLAYVQVTKRIQ